MASTNFCSSARTFENKNWIDPTIACHNRDPWSTKLILSPCTKCTSDKIYVCKHSWKVKCSVQIQYVLSVMFSEENLLTVTTSSCISFRTICWHTTQSLVVIELLFGFDFVFVILFISSLIRLFHRVGMVALSHCALKTAGACKWHSQPRASGD